MTANFHVHDTCELILLWYNFSMDIQRTVTIMIEPDKDLERTLEAFREVQHALSEPCFNEGQPLHALALQRLCYHSVKGTLNAQMTISAIRMVAGAYVSAKSNKKPATRPFFFKKARALFLIGKRGRDADFRKAGTQTNALVTLPGPVCTGQCRGWQHAIGVPSSDSSSSPCAANTGNTGQYCREVPDVALNADPNVGYITYCTVGASCQGQTWLTVGGTSAAAPMWAAMIALAKVATISVATFFPW
jgi:hypothetical protein